MARVAFAPRHAQDLTRRFRVHANGDGNVMDDHEHTPHGESGDDMARNSGVGATDMTEPGTGDRPIDEEHDPERGHPPRRSPLSRFSRPDEIAPSRGSVDGKESRS